ncbi:MAG: hypothetical protein AVDCRST_MAG26-4201 [uncultured Chloroflexia bacterium]|uniref:Uncharacterized protein n=1 Tax=uncultured Chloroflexia bacterium TaxID=1672391 RepID=A0A6J4K0J7_9CHLR|nr:MAG: hypothetical protein AVDCRST_MAG26-4201 [uncultured Chloroflexia bacterium]
MLCAQLRCCPPLLGRAFDFKTSDLRLELLVPEACRQLGGVAKQPGLTVNDAVQHDFPQRLLPLAGQRRVRQDMHQFRLEVAGTEARGQPPRTVWPPRWRQVFLLVLPRTFFLRRATLEA